ncbi:carboxymuconolactone decarboxylase family protein [Rhizobium sp. Root483D2]|uniref:carboxymuconolactone decarboxylase family protein n=1 Tax=Rhizobium sp. Root483D2 TaxID=1736545 RepID=UPI000713F0E6|nr:carboxymuconolactone decarboxylase family protein [Rhizobium sp. Root483D2]KQY26383.1 hypothetical protein ASD32_25805 [Rhizobium sp. Root483D2]
MYPHIYPGKETAGGFTVVSTLDRFVASSGLDEHLIRLLSLRAFKINGCAHRLDAHTRKLATTKGISFSTSWRSARPRKE